jgi:hypothetical protein
MSLDRTNKSKILFCINLLSDVVSNGNNLQVINFAEKKIKFSDNTEMTFSELNDINNQVGGNKNIFKSQNFSDTSSINMTVTDFLSNTSPVEFGKTSNNYSDTSDMSQQKGGNRDIFKSQNFSDTSSVNMTNMENLSNTSPVNFNKKTNGYSDTSEMSQQKGGNRNIFKSQNFSDTSSVNMTNMENLSNTSSVNFNQRSDGYSDTSDMSQQKGGNRNIFKSQNFSDTSFVNMTNMENLSNTSSVNFNQRSDGYSDTSEMSRQKGGNKNIFKSQNFSDTLDFVMTGGKNNTSDTLMSLSELKDRNRKKSSKLGMDIFNKLQSGGHNDINIRKKMLEMGINSSSTSSVCE